MDGDLPVSEMSAEESDPIRIRRGSKGDPKIVTGNCLTLAALFLQHLTLTTVFF